MIKVAGLAPSNRPLKKYELVMLNYIDDGKPLFQSELHFSKFPLSNENDILREIKENQISIISIDSTINIQTLKNELNSKIEIMELEACYLSLGFISNKEQIRKESDLWRVQMQDSIRRLVRGIDGPCDGVYESDTIDAFVLALALSVQNK